MSSLLPDSVKYSLLVASFCAPAIIMVIFFAVLSRQKSNPQHIRHASQNHSILAFEAFK
jgi:hypothetical protein